MTDFQPARLIPADLLATETPPDNPLSPGTLDTGALGTDTSNTGTSNTVTLDEDASSGAPNAIEGEAIVTVARGARGTAELTGTFKSSDETLKALQQQSHLLYHYQGPAFEGDKRYQIEATVLVTHFEDGLHELSSRAEPVFLQGLD